MPVTTSRSPGGGKRKIAALTAAAVSLGSLGLQMAQIAAPTTAQAATEYGPGIDFKVAYSTQVHGDAAQTGSSVVYCDSAKSKDWEKHVKDGCKKSETFKATGNKDKLNHSSNGEWSKTDDGYWNHMEGKNFASKPASGMHNSSSSPLTIPSGAKVKKAVLMWGGCTDNCSEKSKFADSGSTYKDLDETKVKFRTPGGSWQSVKASKTLTLKSNPSNKDKQVQAHVYSSEADVTKMVSKSGTFSVGDIQFKHNTTNAWGNWHLAVAYEKSGDPLRQIAFYRGLVGISDPVKIDIPKFSMPQSGPFNPKFLLGTMDGDPGTGGTSNFNGDYFAINGTKQTQKPYRGDDKSKDGFFSSRVTDADGKYLSGRTPSFPNTYGLDIAELQNPKGLTRTSDGIQMEIGTGGEGVWPYFMGASVEVNPSDLSVTKDDGKTLVKAGEETTYDIVVKNNGDGDEPQAKVKDKLPKYLTFKSASDKGKLNKKTGLVEFPAFALKAGATKHLSVTATVDKDVPRPTNLTNVVTVGGFGKTPPDPEPGSKCDDSKLCDTDVDKTAPPAEVHILKTHVDGDGTPGGKVTWKVDIDNTGKSDATNTKVTDTVPDQIDPDSVEAQKPSQGSFDAKSAVWNVGTLKAGDKGSITLTGKVKDNVKAGTKITNVAKITTPDDPKKGHGDDCEDNTKLDDDKDGCDLVSIQPKTPELKVLKEHVDGKYTEGDTVTWKVSVKNSGGAVARDVEVADTLPKNVDAKSVKSADPSQGKFDDATAKWAVGDLAVGKTATVTVSAKVTKVSSKPLVNEVKATSPDVPPTPGDDCEDNTTLDGDKDACDVVKIDPEKPDLKIVKDHVDGKYTEGGTVTWKVTVGNDGKGTAHDVKVTDKLPANVDAKTLKAEKPSMGTFDTGNASWAVGDLKSGQTATVQLSAKVTKVTDKPLINEARVTSPDTPGTGTGDKCEDNTSLKADKDGCDVVGIDPEKPELKVLKEHTDGNATVGSDLGWKISVKNSGATVAHDVKVTDTLPKGVDAKTLKAQKPSMGSFDNAKAVWTVGDLKPGQTATVELHAKVVKEGKLTNQARATTPDLPPSKPGDKCEDNTTLDGDKDACDVVTIDPKKPDLKIVKTTDAKTAPAKGGKITWTIKGGNFGGGAAHDVKVTDTLPDGVDASSVKASDVSKGSFDTKSATWTIGDLKSGEKVSIKLTATVDKTGELVNLAKITSPDDPKKGHGNNCEDNTSLKADKDGCDLVKVPGPGNPPPNNPNPPKDNPPANPGNPGNPDKPVHPAPQPNNPNQIDTGEGANASNPALIAGIGAGALLIGGGAGAALWLRRRNHISE